MSFEVKDDRLIQDGVPVSYRPAKVQGGRIEPNLIVIHDTAGHLRPFSSVEWFQSPQCTETSAHIVVERDGTVTQMLDLDRKANHAGKSEWQGRAMCNGWSIGIEIVSPGGMIKRGEEAMHLAEGSKVVQRFPISDCLHYPRSASHSSEWWLPYTDAQLETVEALVLAIAEAYPTITSVAGHYEISPGRKQDPGPHFPIAEMRELILHRALNAPDPDEIKDLQTVLTGLGYHTGGADGCMGPRTRAALRTFQEQNGLAITGQFDTATLDKLKTKETAKAFPAGAREEVSKADVKAASGQSSDAGVIKRAAEIAIVTGATEAATAPPAPAPISLPTAIDSAGDVVRKVENARGIGTKILDIMAWAQTPRGVTVIGFILLAGLIWLLAHRIDWRRWRDAVLGRHLGGKV